MTKSTYYHQSRVPRLFACHIFRTLPSLPLVVIALLSNSSISLLSNMAKSPSSLFNVNSLDRTVRYYTLTILLRNRPIQRQFTTMATLSDSQGLPEDFLDEWANGTAFHWGQSPFGLIANITRMHDENVPVPAHTQDLPVDLDPLPGRPNRHFCEQEHDSFALEQTMRVPRSALVANPLSKSESSKTPLTHRRTSPLLTMTNSMPGSVCLM